MTPTTRPQAPTSVARDRAAGVGRPGGMFTAAVTAAVVFLAGRQFLAPSAGPEVLSPSPMAQVTPPPPAAPEAGAMSATGADPSVAADAAAASPASDGAVAVAAIKPDKPAEAEPAKSDDGGAKAKPDKTGQPAAEGVSPEDKDLAREAWRRNKPEVKVADGKSMILVPLKGSSELASHKYLKKTRTLIVTLPKAASLNTLRFYKLNKEGFANLWTDQEETNAKAADGTKLRLVFAQHAVPVVEIHDEFVRVTIARPSPTKPAPPKAAPVEKPEPREEPAPSDDKPKPKEKEKEKEKDAD